MEQNVIKGWVLVDLDDPLQHVGEAEVGQPHAERFIQPHPLTADTKKPQKPPDQCD